MNKHTLNSTQQGIMKSVLVYIFSWLFLWVSNPGHSAPPDAFSTNASQFSKKMDSLVTELEDHDDFYMLNTGEKATFLRKKNIYVLINNKEAPKPVNAELIIQHQFSNDVDVIKNHRMGHHTVVRFTGTQVNRASTLQQFSSFGIGSEFVSPMLTGKDGLGQIAVKPGLVVRLQEGVEANQALGDLKSKFGLDLREALKFTDQEFELRFAVTPRSVSDIFKATREIMSRPDIEWAEPLFVSTPIKLHTPNDPLYINQWHLNNTGQKGALIDADIDAPEGWDFSRGGGTVIAIIDDGVQTNHPDLRIWSNPGESGNGKESNGIDDDGNGYVDDFQGWDFIDGDNDPNPVTRSGDCKSRVYREDCHGTAVAGVAAATGNNSLGVTGSAPSAEILPVRANQCATLGTAIRYAAMYADVVNNSWGINACHSSINSAISDAVHGKIPNARRGSKGTPVLFASGNSASGWKRIASNTIVTANTPHTFRWNFRKDGIISSGFDTVWLDNIVWPDGTITDFENDIVGAIPTGFTTTGDADWSVVSDGVHTRGSLGNSAQAGNIADNQTSTLEITRTFPTSGPVTFWIWVSAEYKYDWMIFSIDGQEDKRITMLQNGHQNDVAYPASNPDTIAVGASTDGATSGEEERIYYSQFGPELDVVAPSNNQNQKITTTDRTGPDGYDDTSDYTSGFGGTSSATPLVAGVVADMLAYDDSLTATQVRELLRQGTDKIGPYQYTNLNGNNDPEGRNDYYGYGRVNLHKTMEMMNNKTLSVFPIFQLLLDK